jgi:pimeloyl-ACP methyl ester carboxylesterase
MPPVAHQTIAGEPQRRFARAEARVFSRYGLSPREYTVELREPRLRVRVIECGDGPPVVLVGGDGAVACAWAPLVEHLAGWRTIMLDRPGFGMSDDFDYRGVDLRRHGVALLGSLVDALGIDAAPVVGSSGGGQWSLWLALDAPERVTALAPMGIPAVCLPGFRPASLRFASLPGLGRLGFALPSPSARVSGRMLARADARLLDHPEIVDAYHAARSLPGYGRAASAIFRASLRIGGAPRRQWVLSEQELARIAAPTLFVWGAREPFGGVEVAARAARSMPNASVALIPGGWHHPWLAQPGAVSRLLLDFLARPNPEGSR